MCFSKLIIIKADIFNLWVFIMFRKSLSFFFRNSCVRACSGFRKLQKDSDCEFRKKYDLSWQRKAQTNFCNLRKPKQSRIFCMHQL